MPQYKILYTADIHGNETQYQKLIDVALITSPQIIIIGGDICPKGFSAETFIKRQREFLKYRLPQILQPLRRDLPNSKLFLMMGNDDCAVNMNVLENEESQLYQVIHGRRINLTDEFDLVGYSYVPITPFGIKDWEKYDLSQTPLNLEVDYMDRKSTNYKLAGVKSTKTGWKKFRFDPEAEKQDSIQKDLTDKIYQKNVNKTIYVIHTPPDNTSLDMVINKNHVGSMAVRLFIEQHQPYLTLHGHIHETVDVSGSFKDAIGNTLCLSSGNHNVGDKLAVLIFDLYNPQNAGRLVL